MKWSVTKCLEGKFRFEYTISFSEHAIGLKIVLKLMISPQKE